MERLKNIIVECEPQFEEDFFESEKNPELIDKYVERILNFDILSKTFFNGHFVKGYLQIFREKFGYKYHEHLMDSGNIQIKGGNYKIVPIGNGLHKFEPIRRDENGEEIMDGTIADDGFESGDGFHPIFFLPLRIRFLFSLDVRLRKGTVRVDELVPKG